MQKREGVSQGDRKPKSFLRTALGLMATFYSTMLLPVVSNWLSEVLGTQLGISKDSLFPILGVSIAAVVLFTQFIEKWLSSQRDMSIDGGKLRNPPGPEGPVLTGIFLSNAAMLHTLLVQCVPIDGLFSPVLAVQTLAPVLVGGALTFVLMDQGSRYAERQELALQAKAIAANRQRQVGEDIESRISALVKSNGRVSQRRLFDEFSQSTIVQKAFLEHLSTSDGAGHARALERRQLEKLIGPTLAQAVNGVNASLRAAFGGGIGGDNEPRAGIKWSPEATAQEELARWYWLFLNGQIQEAMFRYIRRDQSAPTYDRELHLSVARKWEWHIHRMLANQA